MRGTAQLLFLQGKSNFSPGPICRSAASARASLICYRISCLLRSATCFSRRFSSAVWRRGCASLTFIPSHFLISIRQRGGANPKLRLSLCVFISASCCFRIPVVCSSVNRPFFILAPLLNVAKERQYSLVDFPGRQSRKANQHSEGAVLRS